MEDLERAIAIANAQPSTSTFHAQPPSVQKAISMQGLNLLNEQVVCHNVSAETLYLPSDDTNTAMNNDESSHVSKHVSFAQESVPVPEKVVSQPVDSGSPLSPSSEKNMKSHDGPPNVNNESKNENEDIRVDRKPNIGATDCPPDALAFKEALSHVSEGMADETEIWPMRQTYKYVIVNWSNKCLHSIISVEYIVDYNI